MLTQVQQLPVSLPCPAALLTLTEGKDYHTSAMQRRKLHAGFFPAVCVGVHESNIHAL